MSMQSRKGFARTGVDRFMIPIGMLSSSAVEDEATYEYKMSVDSDVDS
jgi:hypothetical protein